MGDSIRVLHVDDDSKVRGMTAESLHQESAQFELVGERRAVGAWERLNDAQGEINCIVSDYSLPGISGIELLKSIRNEYSELPFIVFTGKGSETVARDALRAGATDYIQKRSGTQQYDLLANRVRNAIQQDCTRQELEANQRRLSRFVEQSPIGIVRWDSEFNFAHLNDTAEEILGYEESELIGQSWEAIVPESNRAAVGDVVRDLLENNGSYRSIHENVRKNGERITCEWHNQAVTAGDGTVVNVFSQFQDVTERKERQHQFEAVFDSSDTLSWLLEPDGTLVEANETALSFGGLDCDTVVDKPLWETYWFRSSEAAETAREAVRQASAGDLYRENIRLRGSDCEALIEFSVRPVTDEHGEVTLLVLEGRDITERGRKPELPEEKTAWLEGLYEGSPDLINVLDADGHLIDMNRRFCEKLGYEESELVGRTIWEIDRFVTAEDVEDLLADFDQGERRKFEGRYERHDGTTFPVEVHLLRLGLESEDRFLAISRDITERKTQERKREQIISRVTDAIVEVDADWQFTLVNDQAEELYGISEDDLLGRDFWDVFSDARDTQFEEEYRSVMESREPTSLVEYYSGLDGWFDVQVYPTDDGGLAFYFRDITEQQKRQRRFEAIFNNTFQFTGLLEPDGTLIEANEAALSFGGLDREDVVGKRVWEADWFEFNEQAQRTARRAVEQARNGEMFRDEVRVKGAEKVATIDFSVRPVTDRHGDVTLLIPEGRDITERKEREQELVESEARYRALAENFPNGAVFLFDETLEYQIVSGAGFDPIETSADDLVGNTIYEVEPYSEAVIETLEPLMTATLDGNTETAEITYEGCIYKLRSVPIRNDDEVIAGLYISQDVTEQRQREQELERQNERLEEFASVVSHDLRNPLNIISARLELAQTECDTEHLAKAETGLERAQALIDDLLTLAREGQTVDETAEVDVTETVQQCWKTVETAEATLELEADITIQANYSRLRQLFENLIRNATEHGESGVTISVGELADGFYVEDDGPGIPESERDKVFEAGYSTSDEGTGFGLNIVAEVVDGHGWEIQVVEGSEGGARFEITKVDIRS